MHSVIQRNWNRFALLLRFGLSGGFATLYYLLAVALLDWLSPWDRMTIHLISFITGVLVSYMVHRTFTFRFRGRHSHALPRFAATMVLAFGLSTGTVHLGTKVLLWPAVPTFLLAVLMMATASFLIMLLWVFVQR